MCMVKIKRQFSIKELDHGFHISIGCKEIATEKSYADVMKELDRYFENPTEVQREYFPGDFECQDAPATPTQAIGLYR